MVPINRAMSSAAALIALTSISCILDFGKFEPGEPGPCGNGVLEPGEQCDDGNVADGDGCSATCERTPVDVALSIGDYQVAGFALRPSVAATSESGADRFIVAWVEQGEGSAYRQVVMRAYDSSGVPVTTDPIRLSAESGGHATCSNMASNSAGRAIVSWAQANSAGEYSVRWIVVEPGGQPDSGGSRSIPESTTANFGSCPSVAATAGGEFCVLWRDAGGLERTWCTDSDGIAAGASATLGPSTTGAEARLWGTHALWRAGDGFVAGWLDVDVQTFVGQALDASGAPQGNLFTIGESPELAYVGSGAPVGTGSGFIASYGAGATLGQAETRTRFVLRRFDAPDDPAGAALPAFSEHVDEYGGRVVAGPAGRYGVVVSRWQDAPAVGCDLVLQRFSAAAAADGDALALVPGSPAYCGLGPAAAASASGNVVVAWSLWDSSDSTGTQPMRTQALFLPGALAL